MPLKFILYKIAPVDINETLQNDEACHGHAPESHDDGPYRRSRTLTGPYRLPVKGMALDQTHNKSRDILQPREHRARFSFLFSLALDL